ncbi:MAG: hypothetical protein WAV56_00585 [Microgenomates group bacterium]
MKNRKTQGQASLVMILLIGFVAVSSAIASSSLSVSNVQIEETVHASDQAWYAAWAGVDELMYRLRARQDFSLGYQLALTLDGGATVSATIEGDSNQKTVKSTGYAAGMIKNLEVKVAASSSKASFIYAIQAGVGGIDLEGQTVIRGSNNTSGNIYSNGAIRGKSTSAGNSGSRVLGGIWAVDYVGGLDSPTTGGVYIQKDAWANSLSACQVVGDVKAPQPPSNCPYSGTFSLSPAPPVIPLASVDADYWKNQAQAGGIIWNGDCIVGSGGPLDCTAGTRVLGERKISGNLTVPSGTDLTLTGPVWITGDFVIDSNNVFYTAEAVGKNSIVIVVSNPDDPATLGRILTSSNVSFLRNSQGAGLVFISENNSDQCGVDPAITTSSNTATVVFVALSGCVHVKSNSILSGILAKKIYVENNSTIEFDPSLAQAILEPDSGGWAVVSVKEF